MDEALCLTCSVTAKVELWNDLTLLSCPVLMIRGIKPSPRFH
ncbi:hypothetical protein M2277_001349 [Paenibacillus sp. LBL]|nr:hypothetical protein [Paenibacillus sp. LBL]